MFNKLLVWMRIWMKLFYNILKSVY
jgi:hypothetical protein